MSTPQGREYLDLDRLPNDPEPKELTSTEVIEAEKDNESFNSDILETAKTNRFKQNTRLRKILAYWSMGIVTIWLFHVGRIVISNDIYQLTDNVLNVLLATTTIEVIGIIYIVMNDLFDKNSEKKIK